MAQEFTMSSGTNVSHIAFAMGVFPTNFFINAIDYGTLTFNVQLTNAIGPSATPVNVIASNSFSLTTQSTPLYVGLNLSVNQILDIGTYFLVMSTLTPIPNSSAVLVLPEATSYFPNVGQLLTANKGTNVPDQLTGCSSSSTVNCDFPPGSTWKPASGPALSAGFEFQVCSQDGDGCGIFTSPPPRLSPVPLPGALPLFAAGLSVLGLLGWHRKRKIASAAD
jgi:hypothetical protein